MVSSKIKLVAIFNDNRVQRQTDIVSMGLCDWLTPVCCQCPRPNVLHSTLQFDWDNFL